MALHEAAELLGCTVPELQRRVSYRELSDWLLYLDGKQRKREKIEYYFAELIVMLGAFHGADIDIDDVLLDWEAEADSPAAAPDPVELGYAMARSFGAMIVREQANGEKYIDGLSDRKN
jgi:hypothetical protein|nr:MAG TPA: Minor tail protein T [Caudoviricetes sp.]